MSPSDFYKTLQVDRHASTEVIEAAYRRLARLYHPDVNHRPDASATMQALNEAYQVLKDPALRRAYDEQLNGHAYGSRATASNHAEPARNETAYDGYSWEDFPRRCEKCGSSDSSLRLAGFPYVISIVILSFRRSWGGLYCRSCRISEMRRAKFTTLLFGWWGIPFGFIHTLQVLFTSAEGILPARENAAYLRSLAGYFIYSGKRFDASEALRYSLIYETDETTARLYEDIYGQPPDLTNLKYKAPASGFVFGLGGIAVLVLLLGYFFAPLFITSSSAGPPYTASVAGSPTRAAATAVSAPTANATSAPASTGKQQNLPLQADALDTSPPKATQEASAGLLRGQAMPPKPKPTDQVVKEDAGYQWVRYQFPGGSLLYPNSWWVERSIDGVHVASEDYSFDMYWTEVDKDFAVLFEYRNQRSTYAQSIAEEIEAANADFIEESTGTVERHIRYDQASIGSFPTLGAHVYTLEVTNDWIDGDRLYIGSAIALCKPTTICFFTYSKIDESLTEADWTLLDIFAESVALR